jgi:membrane peptidoglycan carboxypeptidase
LVINHVLSELDADAVAVRGRAWTLVASGGYDIVTTIDPRAQQVLEHGGPPRRANSVMYGQPARCTPAAVAVEPGTGRVLAYYGGADGAGMDHAGVYVDEEGQVAGYGYQPPGGTFLVHTLAAALNLGISLRSYWVHTPHDQPGRPRQNPSATAASARPTSSASGRAA